MPVYRGVKISMISQYGAQALPEYSPRISDHDTPTATPDHVPAVLDSTTQTATVYIPIFPRSLYWIRYHVQAPERTPFFYFKAFVNGVHVVSWGVGDADGYEGKTMFGLYDSGQGKDPPSRQLLAFSDDTSLDHRAAVAPGAEALEIRVYRAKARRLVPTVVPPLVSQCVLQNKKNDTVRFRNAFGSKAGGKVDESHPITQYEYALKDPIDAPYATFRWLPRTWHEIDQLDVVSLDSEPGCLGTTLDLVALSNSTKETAKDTQRDTESQAEHQKTPPSQVSEVDSPLRVPVYQVSCSTLEPSESPTRDSISRHLASPKDDRTSNAQTNSECDKREGSRAITPRRSRVLEPYNSFDCVATARPASRTNLLDSVVTQMRARPPSSPHSKKALRQYLERRPSERSSNSSTDFPVISPVAHVGRVRTDSHQAQLEHVWNDDLEEASSRGSGEAAEDRDREMPLGPSDIRSDDGLRRASDHSVPRIDSDTLGDSSVASLHTADIESGLVGSSSCPLLSHSQPIGQASSDDKRESLESPLRIVGPNTSDAIWKKRFGSRLLKSLSHASLRPKGRVPL